MYAQSYRQPAISIPDRYDGTALEATEAQSSVECADDCCESCTAHHGDEAQRAPQKCESQKGLPPSDGRHGLLDLPFGGFISSLLENANIGLHKIGLEEIILAAAALYLFLSKDGDKECAIILAILFFIN